MPMTRKRFDCLAGATLRERVTLAPLSRADRVRYVVREVMVLGVFLVSVFLTSWLVRLCNG